MVGVDSLDEVFPSTLITPTMKKNPTTSSLPSLTIDTFNSFSQHLSYPLTEEETMELTILMSEQDFQYGMNMFEMSSQDIQDAKRIATLKGIRLHKALENLFNKKVASRTSSPGLISNDSFYSTSSSGSSSPASSPKKVRFAESTIDYVKTSKPKKHSSRRVPAAPVVSLEPEPNLSTLALEMQRLAFESFEQQKKSQQRNNLRRTQSDNFMYASSPVSPTSPTMSSPVPPTRRTLHRSMSDGFYNNVYYY